MEPAFDFAGAGGLADKPCPAVLQGLVALSLHLLEQAAFDLEMRLAVESRNLQNRVVFADRRDVLLYARVDTDGVFGRFPDILGYFLVDKGNDYAAGLQGDPDDLGLLVFR